MGISIIGVQVDSFEVMLFCWVGVALLHQSSIIKMSFCIMRIEFEWSFVESFSNWIRPLCLFQEGQMFHDFCFLFGIWVFLDCLQGIPEIFIRLMVVLVRIKEVCVILYFVCEGRFWWLLLSALSTPTDWGSNNALHLPEDVPPRFVGFGNAVPDLHCPIKHLIGFAHLVIPTFDQHGSILR